MTMLDKEQIIRLHAKMIATTGGLDGLSSEPLLASALSAAFQTFDGIDLYASTTAKIARITYGLVRNHPFADGNKRIGTCVMLVLLALNHIETDFTDEDIIRIGLALADGTMNDQALLRLIVERSI